MNAPIDGGPAFARPASPTDYNCCQDGMTLRDYFAAQVMAQCICLCTTQDGCTDFVAASVAAYQYANAMLSERQKARAK